MRKEFGLILVLLFASQTSLAARPFSVTPSGAPEAVFLQTPVEIAGVIASKCIDVGMKVVRSNSGEVVCESQMGMGESVATQLLIGNSYSTPPRRFITFVIIDTPEYARVQASGWIETQMAFGQINRVDLDNTQFHNDAMGFLAAAGGQAPIGTTFPNHVLIGFDSEPVSMGRNIGFRVKSVTDGSVGAAAGLQPEDIVVRVAGKRFKTEAQYFEATERAARSERFKVEVMRDGERVELLVARAFREPVKNIIGTRPTPQHLAESASAAFTEPASIADELEKLAKLKEAGVLTQSEFDAQKEKLLAR